MPEKTLTIWLPLASGKSARMQLTVVEDGLGAIDQDTERQPTVFEMDDIASQLDLRSWTANKPS